MITNQCKKSLFDQLVLLTFNPGLELALVDPLSSIIGK